MKITRWIAVILVIGILISPVAMAESDELICWADPERQDILNEIVNEFTKQTGISVRIVSAPLEDLLSQYLEVGLFGNPASLGDTPDIIFDIPHNWIGELVRAKVIAPLDNFPKENLQEFFATALEALTLNGKLYGLPLSLETHLLIYNKDLFDNEALEYPKNSWTWDNLIGAARKMSVGDQLGFLFDAKSIAPTWSIFSGHGASLFSKNITTGGLDVELVSPGAIEAAEFLSDLVKNKIILPEYSDGHRISDLFSGGKVAMIIDGSWSLGTYERAGINYGVATIPMFSLEKIAKPFVFTNGIVLDRSAVGKKAAYQFLSFVTNKENIWNISTEGVFQSPSRKDTLAQFEHEDSIITTIAEQVSLGDSIPNIHEMLYVWSPVNKALNLIIDQEVLPHIALSDAQREIEVSLDGLGQLHRK